MPFSRPSLTVLVDRVSDDIDSRLPGADSRLRRSVLNVLARVFAAGAHGLYGLLDWIWRQVFPDTAEAEQLARWASIWGLTRKGATLAMGYVKVAGVNGSMVPAAALLLRSDGVELVTAATATIAGGETIVAVAANAPGASGNTAAGSKLTFASPVVGVQAVATVEAPGLIGGGPEESDEALRARLLARIRRPPHGGNRSDYERWALEVPGVTRAWIYPLLLGPGTVSLYFVMDGRENPIPLPADVAAVQAYINERRPVTANVSVFAPRPEPLELTIQAFPSSPAVRAAIEAEVADLLFREAVPGGTLLISHLREAVSLAAGEVDHVVLAPDGNVSAEIGSIHVPGAITWVGA
jgi:uncharacterized phage protein gp47/JayE